MLPLQPLAPYNPSNNKRKCVTPMWPWALQGRPAISYSSICQFPGGKYSAVNYIGVGVVYSTATPQLLRKLSAAGCGQTKTGHSSDLENSLVAATRIFKQRDPSTDESAVSPASGLSTDAADNVYAASVLRPLAAETALASFGGARCLTSRNGATKDFPNMI